MNELTALKDFLDLGGTFVLALVLLYCGMKRLDLVNDKLTKVLTLLSVLVKVQTNFNGVEKVLGKDLEKVEELIVKSETEEKTSL